MSMPLLHSVADVLGFSQAEVSLIAAKAQKTYKHYKIPKKRGGLRSIHHPSKETKSLQYALISILENSLQPHPCAMAYRRNLTSPLRKNAEIHSKFPFTLRVDFKDFFPSITPADLFASLEDPLNLVRIDLSPEDKSFMAQALFTVKKDGSMGLPIGAPSSPLISNAVMRQLDTQIEAYAKTHEFVYSRYADDLMFSCMKKGASKPFLAGLRTLVNASACPRMTINDAKTHFMSRNSRRAVTGLIIAPDGGVSIGRPRKRFIRKLINDFKTRRLSEKQNHVLQGHLAFILDVDPSFYDRLCMKYSAPLILSALRNRGG